MEKDIKKAKLSINIVFIKATIFVILIILLFVYLTKLMNEAYSLITFSKLMHFRNKAILITLVIGIIDIIPDIINYKTTELIITNKRIKGRKGLYKTEELDSPLNKISSISVKQGIFGKIFNYGEILISTPTSVHHFKLISDVNDLKTIINNQIEEYDELRIKTQAKELAKAMKEK